jgi:anti-sigma regulatory factor (Ser/Thr protein kinase)
MAIWMWPLKKNDRIVIRFEDGGVPFNPLEHKMPDVSLSWEDRSIGGLGIMLVIKKMDGVSYAYVDYKNVLTIEKVINSN